MSPIVLSLIILSAVSNTLLVAILIAYVVTTFNLTKKNRKKPGSKIKKINVKSETIFSFIRNLANALAKMSSNNIGALIVIENKDSLYKYIELGNRVESAFFVEFVYSVFYNHASALHDGAMIIKNWNIVSLSSYLPVSKRLLDVKYGARHRAAFGISELTDAMVFVVSETSGAITYIHLDTVVQLSREPVALADQIFNILTEERLIDTNDERTSFGYKDATAELK